MSDDDGEQRPARKPRNTAAQQKAAANQIYLVAALLTLALSLGFLLIVVADALDGGPEKPATGTPETATTAPELPTEVPTATAKASQPTAPPTATRGTQAPGATNTPDTAIAINCLDILAPADKQHRMAPGCAPGDLVAVPGSGETLRSEAASAFAEMVDAAKKEGLTLIPVSGFRSYQTQEAVYDSAVRSFGQEYADRTSAKPGFSEHQLGTTMDVSASALGGDLQESFADTPEGKWVNANSWRYGFIISYPAGSESITGYAFEPWHLRFVGKSTAQQVRNSGLTLHEFLLRR